MSKKMKIIIIIIMGIILFGFFVEAIWTSDGNVRASILGLITAVILAIVAQYYANVRAIQASHFPEKRAAYELFFDLLFDLFEGVKDNKPMSDQELVDKMMDFKKQLMVWGSYDTMVALRKVEEISEQEDSSAIDMHLTMDDLLKAARKDLGHDDSAVPSGGIVSLLLDKDGRQQLQNAGRTSQPDGT